MRRALVVGALLTVLGACAAPTSSTPTPEQKDTASGVPTASLAGTWRTGDIAFADIEAAIVDEGLPTSDFEAWAETQEMVPWPAGDGDTGALATEMTLDEDGTFLVTVESNGERLGVAEQGTWTYDGEILNLATGPGLVNHVLLTPTLTGDYLAITVLDIQEIDHDAAYAHLLNAVAYYASGTFTRAD